MALLTFMTAQETDALLAAIDALDSSAQEMQGTLIFEDFSYGAGGTTFGGADHDLYVITDGATTTFQLVWSVLDFVNSIFILEYQFALTIEGVLGGDAAVTVGSNADSYGLEGALEADGQNDFVNQTPTSVIRGFDTADEMMGQGRFVGSGGGDEIELVEVAFTSTGVPIPVPGGALGSATETSVARGGGGADVLIAAVLDARLSGGAAGDTLIGQLGQVVMKGDGGRDTFVFDNGARDVGGTVAQGSEALRALIRDFDAGGETIVLGFTDGAMGAGDPPVTQTLEDLVGAATLDTLGAVVVDGVTISFGTAGDGDALIFRVGTDGEGRTYDERIRVDGLGLADLDASDIVLQEYGVGSYDLV